MTILDLSGYARREKLRADVSKQVQVPKVVQAKVAAAMVYEDRKEGDGRPKMTDVYVHMLIAGYIKIKDWEVQNPGVMYPFKDLHPVKHESAPILLIPHTLNEALKAILLRYPDTKSVVPIINSLIELGCEDTPTRKVK